MRAGGPELLRSALAGMAHRELRRARGGQQATLGALTRLAMGIPARLALGLDHAKIELQGLSRLGELSGEERAALVGRCRVRAVDAATRPLLLEMAATLRAALSAELRALAPFAEAADALLGGSADRPPSPTLAARLRVLEERLGAPEPDPRELALDLARLELALGLPVLRACLLGEEGSRAQGDALQAMVVAALPEDEALLGALRTLVDERVIALHDVIDQHLCAAPAPAAEGARP